MVMKKLILIAACIFTAAYSVADIMPEPQIVYNFKYFTDVPLEINPSASEQIQCEDALCMESAPLGSYGLQKLNCGKEECFASAYEFKPFQKLAVSFNDGKTRYSHIFKAPDSLRSAMQVNVYKDGLEVLKLPFTSEDRSDKFYVYLSLISAVILELIAAFIFLKVEDLSMKILFSVAEVNLIFMPLGWWVLSKAMHNTAVIWTASFIFELFFIFLLNRGRITLKETAGLVLVANIASFSLGMVISYMFVSL
jgi:hypothetical protein